MKEQLSMAEIDALRIKTERLTLCPLSESDASAASRNSRQPAATRYMADMVWDTEKEALEFIKWFNREKFSVHTPHVIFGVFLKSNRRCIGFAGVGPKPELGDEIELGYLIADEYKNRGYATEAGKAVIWWTFERAGLDALSAITNPENKASIRVLEKLGFVFGKTKIFPDGAAFDYYRLYHTDMLPGPVWDIRNLHKPEGSGAILRADK